MAIGLVQSRLGGSGSGTTSVTTSSVGYTSTTTAGNLLVCVCWADSDVGIPIITAPATSGFTWALQNPATYSNTTLFGRVSVYAIVNAGAMSATTKFTATRSGASFIQAEFALYEFSGVQTTTPLDTSAATSNGGPSAPGTASLVTTATDLIFVSYIGFDSFCSVGSGFTAGIGTSAIVGAGESQYILNQTSGTIATAFGSSDEKWGCVALAFKSNSSNGTATPAGVSMTSTNNAPSGTGSASVSPAGVTMSSGEDAPTATVTVSVSVDGVTSLSAVGAAVGTSTSSAFANPAGVGMASATNTPSTTASSQQSATGVSATSAVGLVVASAAVTLITVTGNLKDLLGIPNPGSVKLTLGGYGASTPIASGISISQTSVTAQADANGLITQVLISNTGILPVNTFYTAIFFDSLGAFVTTQRYRFTANADLSTQAGI